MLTVLLQRREDGFAELERDPGLETFPYIFIGSFCEFVDSDGKVWRAYVSAPTWVKWSDLGDYSKAMADDLRNFMFKQMKPKIVCSSRHLRNKSVALLQFKTWGKEVDPVFDVDYFLDRGVDQHGEHYVLVVWQPIWFEENDYRILNPNSVPKIISDKVPKISKREKKELSK